MSVERFVYQRFLLPKMRKNKLQATKFINGPTRSGLVAINE